MTTSCRSTAIRLLVVVLAVSSCGQPTAERVVSASAPAGETTSSPKPASSSVQTSLYPPPRLAVGTVPMVEQGQQEHRAAEATQCEQWYTHARESPDVSVRLQALETWAQQPDAKLDPVTYGLVDQDESVRTRAQELYEQVLMQETTMPSAPGR